MSEVTDYWKPELEKSQKRARSLGILNGKLLVALELIQGFNWQLDESDHGKEIKRRALEAIADARK